MRLFLFGFFLSLAVLGRIPPQSPVLSLTFFDVGQGDAALIQFPNRSAWLVDAGGGFEDWDVGRDLVLEMARYGVLSLDAVVISHPDLDHVMGFRTVLDQIPVRAILLNRYFLSPPNSTPLLKWILGKVQKGEGALRPIEGLTAFSVGGAQGRFFSPAAQTDKANEHSLVLELEYAGCRFLLTGDLEKQGEAALLRSPLKGRYAVIKVAHHGSKTSSGQDFLNAFPAKLVVISSGAGNSYGHPHPTVVRRLLKSGSQVFRTDFHGALRFEVSPEGLLTCSAAEGPCGTYQCR